MIAKLTLTDLMHGRLTELGAPREANGEPLGLEERLALVGLEMTRLRCRVDQLERENRGLRIGTRAESRWPS